jgi:phosphoglycolate phosphatase
MFSCGCIPKKLNLNRAPMKTVRLLIFDLDGTLVNTLDDIAASLNYTLARLGRQPLPADTVRQYVGDGITMLLVRALGGRRELLDDAVALYKDHQRENLVVRTHLYPGVRETLEHFRGVSMGVVTNKAREFSAPLLERLDVLRYFETVIGADSGLPLKPAPDAFLKLMKDAGARPEETAVVGDGTTDIRAGKAAGITTCAVTYGFRSEDELKKTGPDHLIRTMPELKVLFAPMKG